MKTKFITMLIIGTIVLSGCTKLNPISESTDEQAEIEAFKASYKKEMQDLKIDQVIAIGKLSKKVAALNGNLEEALDEHAALKNKSEILELAVFGKIKNDNDLYQDIKQDGSVYKVYTEGTDYLEDGIVCVIEVLDQNGKTIWRYMWEGIDVSEVASHSPITIVGKRIYIVVDGELIAMEKESGRILWRCDQVGYSFQSPLVGNDGTIYTIGQYEPYLTAVSHEGKLKWQLISDEMYGIEQLGVCNDYLVVNLKGEILLFDKDGNKLK
jgi:hypothetical protein